MSQPGKRFSALVEFKGNKTIVGDIRARDAEHARVLLAKRQKRFFKYMQVPTFQQKTYQVLGLFYGTIKFAE